MEILAWESVHSEMRDALLSRQELTFNFLSEIIKFLIEYGYEHQGFIVDINNKYLPLIAHMIGIVHY